MQQGTVSWFSTAKGFGFIKTDGGDDVFVHHSFVQNEAILKEGEKVLFETVPGIRGTNAKNVQEIGPR